MTSRSYELNDSQLLLSVPGAVRSSVEALREELGGITTGMALNL